MKKMAEDYWKEIKYFITNKKYMLSLIIVTLLSYGFTITHYSIGADDLCFDRYVDGTYNLSQKRWGTWILYNLLNIHKFTPFWLDLLVAILIMFLAILICSFIRKNNTLKKDNLVAYIIFSCIMVSYPLIFNFFVYQVSNLSVVISNTLITIAEILIYENYFNNNKKPWIFIISIIMITFSISLYQSSIETFLLLMFLGIFINNRDKKQNFKFFIINVGIIVGSLILYLLVSEIIILTLKKIGKYRGNFSSSVIFWNKLDTNNVFIKITSAINNVNLLISEFNIGGILLKTEAVFLICIFTWELYLGINNKNYKRFICLIGMILSAVSLVIFQGIVISRTQFTWSISTALVWFYMVELCYDKKIYRYIMIALSIYAILMQTKTISDSFYHEYKRYEKEKNIAIDIGMNITKNNNYKKKPVAYVGIEADKNIYGYVFKWGQNAFDDYDYEITKFIDYFGFSLNAMNPKDNDEVEEIYKNMSEEQKNETIIETDKYILVNMRKYGFK